MIAGILVGAAVWILCTGLVYPSVLRRCIDNCPYSSHNTKKFSRVSGTSFDTPDDIFHRPDARRLSMWGPVLVLFYMGQFFNGDSKAKRRQAREIEQAEHMRELSVIRLEEAQNVEKALACNVTGNSLNL